MAFSNIIVKEYRNLYLYPFLVLLAGVSISFGSIRLLTSSWDSSNPLLIIFIGVPSALIILISPAAGSLILIAFAFVNPALLPPVTEFGEVTLRYSDLFLLLLGLSILFQFLISSSQTSIVEIKSLTFPIIPFLLYIGLSVSWVRYYSYETFPVSLVSYLRLVATAIFAFLIHKSIKTKFAIRSFNFFIISLSIVSVIIGAFEFKKSIEDTGTTVLVDRASGILGPNTLGLVSGLLCLYSVISIKGNARKPINLFYLIIGIAGLFLTKSASSILATLIVILLVISTIGIRRIRFSVIYKGVSLGLITAIIFLYTIQSLRESDTKGLFDLSGGSFSQRIMLMYGGIRIFLDHPILGTGWQATNSETFMGSYSLNSLLMRKFTNLPQSYFFFDKSTSVHNMYVQFLAELGIVGFGLFIYACRGIYKSIKNSLAEIDVKSVNRNWARFYSFGLVYLLVWWNTNPLYGGQTESILAFAFLGILASIFSISKNVKQKVVLETGPYNK